VEASENGFGERIKAIRVKSGLTQEKFARKIDEKRIKYAKIEIGMYKPSFKMLRAISKKFKVSYNYLFGIEQTTDDNIKE
jgi:transcriptional regulator with XRE-family HTH domain